MLKLFFEILQKVYLGIPFWNVNSDKKNCQKFDSNQKLESFLSYFCSKTTCFLNKLIPNRANLCHLMPRWTRLPPHNSTQLNDNFRLNNIKAWLTGLVIQNYHLIKQIATFSDIFGGITFVSKKVFCNIFNADFGSI